MNEKMDELTQLCYKKLQDLNYQQHTLNAYKRHWKRWATFCEENGFIEFSVEASEEFLKSAAISLSNIKNEKSTDRHIKRSLEVLLMFTQTGCVIRRGKNPNSEIIFSTEYMDTYQKFIKYCNQIRNIAPRTMRLRKREVKLFLVFCSTNGNPCLSNLTGELIHKYFRSYVNLASKTMALKACNIRSFLKFLIENYSVSCEILKAIPIIKVLNYTRLPDVWPKEAIDKLLAVIDRASPVGKRDYAILLLAVELGMRVGDIRELLIENLDWKNAKIIFTQKKTQKILYLPMSNQIGNALIDYLKYGRPITNVRNIFVRHLAPFEEFGPDNNLHHIISKYRIAANIELPKECQVGIHSLRHTIATRLHEAGVGTNIIQSLLGHSSPNSVRQYARTNIEMLRKVALEINIENGVEND